jgi:hypothetical protein
MGNNLFEKFVFALLALYCITLAVSMQIRSEEYQWDFKIYYYAAKAHAAGLNPYDTNALSDVAHEPVGLPYTYPPFTLYLFYPLTFMALNKASWLFLTVKCFLLIGLVHLWKKDFLGDGRDPLFYPFCLLAFNSAVCVDIWAGNITSFEQFFIWTAFHFFLRNRWILFCLFLMIGALFRVTPIAFLLLFCFSNAKRKELYLLLSAAAFLLGSWISYSIHPDQFSDFLNTVSALHERGFQNPSTLPLTRDVLEIIAGGRKGAVSPRFEWIPYGTLVTGILFVTWRAYRVIQSVVVKDRERLQILLMCLAYALILPRFKDYSYISLIVPTYFLLVKIRFSTRYLLLFVFSILPIRQLSMLWPRLDLGLLWEYYVLILVYLVWGMYVYELLSLRAGPSLGKRIAR